MYVPCTPVAKIFSSKNFGTMNISRRPLYSTGQ